jgi:hypothetical protein
LRRRKAYSFLRIFVDLYYRRAEEKKVTSSAFRKCDRAEIRECRNLKKQPTMIVSACQSQE